MSRLIICGQGHGIECVYDGLRQAQMDFILVSPDPQITGRAQQDGMAVMDYYLDAIQAPDDIVLTAAYKPKIPKDHLARCRFINIHYALLPRYRGMHAIVWSILNGEDKIGFTVHETSELLDQGAVIYQEALPIGDFTSWELMMQMDARVTQTIAGVVESYRSGRLKAVPQIEENAIFVAPRNRNDCRVIWKEWDAIFFKRALQALVLPYPRPYFFHKDRMIEIIRAEIVTRDYVEIPGHVVYVDHDSVWAKIPGGLLRMYELQFDGETVKAPSLLKSIGLRLE